MASPIENIGYLSHQDVPEFVETWRRCFAACAREKKLKDNKENGGENEIIDLFLVSAGYEAIMKISLMICSRELKELTFD